MGFDALGIYVHPANPITGISMEELAAIFGENRSVTQWSQLGVTMPRGVPDKIIRVSRQNSSGTYSYFREHVLGKGKDMGLGSVDANGSKDVVALVSRTPCAIGYSGMGYATPDVKMVPVAKQRGQPGVAPTVENAKSGAYPITRPLLIYTVGEPAGAVGEYLEWILSREGQDDRPAAGLRSGEVVMSDAIRSATPDRPTPPAVARFAGGPAESRRAADRVARSASAAGVRSSSCSRSSSSSSAKRRRCCSAS